jgi:dTMP kinase
MGMFFSFDGIDGTGKTTQIERFSQWLLRQGGKEVIVCRDPGGTELGEAIRELLLDRHELQISPMAEMLLYMAARAQLVEQVIKPALADGKIVVSDRFLLANVVYQGHAGGLDVDRLWELGAFITQGIEPDLTFLLDMPAAPAQSRIDRELDRMERRGDDYRERLRAGFLVEAARRPDRIIVIDASRSIDEVHGHVRAAAEPMLKRC